MKDAGIAVFGSLNYDFSIVGDHLPVPGETVKGTQFLMQTGGKGANQALQAARLGARTYMIGCVGRDFMGDAQLASLSSEGMITDHIVRHDSLTTGTACIFINTAGQNEIMVVPGANTACTRELLDAADSAFADSGVFLTQFETNTDAVLYALEKARKAGCTILLDPAPMQQVPAEIWAMADIVKPNETEAAYYTGIPVEADDLIGWAKKASTKLREMGAPAVLITLGANGCYFNGAEEFYAPPFRIKAVDATAAGDSFAGALGVALSEGMDMRAAVRFASAAGAITASKAGAQMSIGRRAEVEAFLAAHAE